MGEVCKNRNKEFCVKNNNFVPVLFIFFLNCRVSEDALRAKHIEISDFSGPLSWVIILQNTNLIIT